MTTMMPEVGSKRSNNYDDYKESDSPKRSRSGKVELRLLLVGRYCGAIIGKGGETVKGIREKHHVQIRGLNNHAENRVLSIIGDRENCINCLSEILSIASAEAPYAASNNKDKSSYEVNLLVNSLHVGAIIGKGGSKIKEIMESSNGMIKIYQDSLPNSEERVVAIAGDSADRIIVAIDIILDTLENLPPKPQTMFYDPTKDNTPIGNKSVNERSHERRSDRQNRSDNHQMNSGGNQLSRIGGLGELNLTAATGLLGQLGANQGITRTLGGAGQVGGYGVNQSQLGSTLATQLTNPLGSRLGQLQSQLGTQLSAQLQNQLGVQLQNQLQNQLGTQLQNQLQNQLGTQLQNLGNRTNLQNQLQNQLSTQIQRQYGSNVPGADGGRSNNHDSRDNYKRNGNDPEGLDFTKMHTVTQVTVTTEICGAIIGKSGRNIKEIRYSSGAQIEFAGNEKGSKEDRVITITGTQRQIQVAEQMMTQYVNERN